MIWKTSQIVARTSEFEKTTLCMLVNNQEPIGLRNSSRLNNSPLSFMRGNWNALSAWPIAFVGFGENRRNLFSVDCTDSVALSDLSWMDFCCQKMLLWMTYLVTTAAGGGLVAVRLLMRRRSKTFECSANIRTLGNMSNVPKMLIWPIRSKDIQAESSWPMSFLTRPSLRRSKSRRDFSSSFLKIVQHAALPKVQTSLAWTLVPVRRRRSAERACSNSHGIHCFERAAECSRTIPLRKKKAPERFLAMTEQARVMHPERGLGF